MVTGFGKMNKSWGPPHKTEAATGVPFNVTGSVVRVVKFEGAPAVGITTEVTSIGHVEVVHLGVVAEESTRNRFT
jgi:hypothetical protein